MGGLLEKSRMLSPTATFAKKYDMPFLDPINIVQKRKPKAPKAAGNASGSLLTTITGDDPLAIKAEDG